MVPFISTKRKKTYKNALQLCKVASKVIHYRKDLLTNEVVQSIEKKQVYLKKLISQRSDLKIVNQQAEILEKTIRQHGGKVYPTTNLSDNIEILLVIAVVLLGIRTFFIQPFKIPTNSMYPTYGGMVPEVFNETYPRPNPLIAFARKIAFFTKSYTVEAPTSGEISFQVFYVPEVRQAQILSRKVPAKSFFILPSTQLQLSMFVGTREIDIRLPAHFSAEFLFQKTFAPGKKNFETYISELHEQTNQIQPIGSFRYLVKTGKKVNKGDPILDFDIITGDMLFVDRFTYHFRKPKVGDPFVFRTPNIPGLIQRARKSGQPISDLYYIKRLVGVGGDTLEVKDRTLYRNQIPNRGSSVFDKNAQQIGEYYGYEPLDKLSPGKSFTIPPYQYFAMGDNSDNSEDSRFFGSIPDSEVIGKALFIYYPLTKRFGLAQ